MTQTQKIKTNNGVKDTFQELFLERIFAFGRTLRGPPPEKQNLLDLFIKDNTPDDTISPVWRIKGMSASAVSIFL